MFHDYDRMQQFVPGASGLRFELSVLLPWTDKLFVGNLFLVPLENAARQGNVADIFMCGYMTQKASRLMRPQPTENSRRVEAGMGPMEDLSRKRIKEVRQEMKEGKREEKGYPDLLSLMRKSLFFTRQRHNGSFNSPVYYGFNRPE